MTATTLPPVDHIFTGVGSYPIEFVFAYDGTLDVDRLKDSLEATLAHFPILRSRLERVGEESYGFRSADDGLTFEVTETYESFDAVESRRAFLDSVESVEEQPLTRIKLTQTPGGAVLGVSISHALVDGFSYFHFLSSWAKIHQGKDILPPSHERSRLIPDRASLRSSITPEDVVTACGVFWDDKREVIDRDALSWDRFFLSDEQIKDLLNEAKEDCAGRLSFNDVIAAWLWRRYLQTGGSQADRLTYLSCPVDFRRILRPLPRSYFGCAVILTTTSLDRDSFAAASLGMLAAKVREAVARVGEEYVINALGVLEALRRQEGRSVLEECHVIHPRDGILVTNLSRLPVNDLAFDAGPPVAFDIQTAAPRGAVVLPAGGGLDVRICRYGGTRDCGGE